MKMEKHSGKNENGKREVEKIENETKRPLLRSPKRERKITENTRRNNLRKEDNIMQSDSVEIFHIFSHREIMGDRYPS